MGTNRNYNAFIWHAFFLALTTTFTEINTVVSSLVLNAGGSSIHIGFITAIMVGIPPISKILFAGYISNRSRKKPFLLGGIFSRVLALTGIGLLLMFSDSVDGRTGEVTLYFIFGLMFLFSVAGSFAGISYTDILGKSLNQNARKHFFIIRQYFQSFGILISALIARQILRNIAYPGNYITLFFAAAIMLFLASLGFVRIREPLLEIRKKSQSFMIILKSVPQLIREDRNLKYFILLQNITGIGLMILPFYISLAKKVFGLTQSEIGNYLLVQIVGAIVSVKLWSKVTQWKGYKHVLKGCVLLSALLPFYALFASSLSVNYYLLVFFLAGFSISARHISFEAVFIDITRDDNRALYAGITGVTNFISVIIPIASGFLIASFGYKPVFMIAPFLLILAIPVLNRIKIN